MEKKFKGHTNRINFIKAIPKLNFFITAANEDSISLWSLESKESITNIPIITSNYQYFDVIKRGKLYAEIIAVNSTLISIWIVGLNKEDNMNKTGSSIQIPVAEILNASIYSNHDILVALGTTKTEFAIVNLFNKGTTDLRDTVEISEEIMNIIEHKYNNVTGLKVFYSTLKMILN